MYKRRFAARQALSGLLAVICLPFLALAKPPDLPLRPLVDCEVKTDGTEAVSATPASGSHVPFANADVLDELVGTFCPGLGDLVEWCWRTLTKWVPVSCAPDYGADEPKPER